jgi:hypothetical protein
LGIVGLRAPCASLCFVEIPLPEASSLGAIPKSLLCGLVPRRGILGGPGGAGFAEEEAGISAGGRDTALALGGLSGDEGSENREVGEVERRGWFCSSVLFLSYDEILESYN